ncbi:dimethylargininase [Phytomonospora endophytica]|uniref:Dimethylargininase n=1 Tax=Phytomonospora endophytica TaxID=714109 RepID=A0A841FZF6_9ACTN|nr:dimethylargininase [Phytomonospora endophytica]MBB6037320.1 dimethylargininase [Phytomonospora endophytica]GIG69936.1 N(G),N(G)-dimethylarginine dimethylaminohydrolase [Phytomonospora endophytica]
MLALVRRPGPRLADGLVTHIERTPVSLPRAMEQWDAYVAAFEGHGWQVREVPPADDCPDAVFVEDAVVMYRNVAVVTRPGAQARRGETAAVREVVEDLGCPVVELRAPATLDGGDVLKVGDTVYVGRGGRTNAAGVAALRAALTPLGATVVAVPVAKVLHLKSAVTALPCGTVIGYPDVVDDAGMYPSFLAVPEESGGHVVDLGQGRLLIAASAPRTADLIADLGYTPVVVDIGEYEKLEGCVTCLSVRVRDLWPRPGG